MKKIIKKSKGITLIALIITVIMLIILASITVYSGKSVIKSSKFTAFTAEMKIMQAQVNELYEKYKNGETIQVGSETYTGEQILNMRKDSTEENYSTNIENSALPSYTQAEKVFTTEESGVTNKEGYLYFNQKLIEDLNIEGVKEEFFVNIGKRSVISYCGFDDGEYKYYTIEQIPKSLYNVEYNDKNTEQPIIEKLEKEEVSDNKWRITVTIGDYQGYINKWNIEYKLEESEDWNTSEDLSFIVNKNGKYLIKVKNGTIESEIREVNCKKIQVGDYVQYGDKLTGETYITESSETGYTTGIQTFQTNKNMLWRVINIKNNGEMEIVADENVLANDGTSGLYLQGKIGYINVEIILDKLCETLYSNSTYGIARSINVKDIDRLTGFSPQTSEWDDKDYYLNNRKKTYTKGIYWQKSSNSFVDASTISGGMTLENTYYYYKVNSNLPLYDSLVAESNNYNGNYNKYNYPMFYYLNTRCIHAYDNKVDHNIHVIANGGVDDWSLFQSFSEGWTDELKFAFGVRPVVTLKSKVEFDRSDDSKDGSSKDKAWKLK